MNTALLAVGAVALAGASFGAGRVTCHASASASAPPATTTTATAATPPAAVASVSCESKDEIAEMIRDRKAKHEEAVKRANARSSGSYKVSDIDPSPVH